MFAYFWKWIKLFILDIKKKEFAAIKILSILILGGLTSLIPFLTIQARSLGITEAEIGIILSVMPVIGIFIPAFAGMLADKVGNFKVYLSSVLLASSFCGLGLLVVPVARVTQQVPDNVPVNLTCSQNGYNVSYDKFCSIKNNNMTYLNVTKCLMNCMTETAVNLDTEWCSITENCNSTGSQMNVENATVHANYLSLPVTVQKYENIINISLINGSCLQEYQMESHCTLNCETVINRDEVCTSNETVKEFNPVITLATYAGVRLLLRIFTAASMPLFEGSVIAIVKEHKGNIGFQRVYLNIGMIIMTPISGLLIDSFSPQNGVADYSPAVYLYFGFNTLCAFLFLFVNLEFKKPSRKVWKNLKSLISKFEVNCLLFVSFLAGGGFGFLETFLFWLLEDLGADKTLMGMTITVGAASGIPIMILSSSIINKFGHANTISFSLAFFVIRFLGYSIIVNPWSAMIFEMMECFTLCLLGVTVVSYISVLATKYSIITLQGLTSSIGGIGHGIGNLLGGFLIKSIGIQGAFRIMSGIYAVSTIIYFVASCFFDNRKDNIDNNKEPTVEYNKPDCSLCN